MDLCRYHVSAARTEPTLAVKGRESAPYGSWKSAGVRRAVVTEEKRSRRGRGGPEGCAVVADAVAGESTAATGTRLGRVAVDHVSGRVKIVAANDSMWKCSGIRNAHDVPRCRET